MIFYTYIYYDPSRNNEPFYIGKGQGNRAWSHFRSNRQCPFVSRLKYMKKNHIKPVIGLYSDLEEEFAHLLEQELISKFGRKDLGLGPLLNMTDGGEGASGIVWSKERKEEWSYTRTNNNPMSGRKQSVDTKTNIGKSQPKTRNYSDENRKFMTTRQQGSKNVMYGKPPTNSISIIYDGISYPSVIAGARANKMSRHVFVKKYKASI